MKNEFIVIVKSSMGDNVFCFNSLEKAKINRKLYSKKFSSTIYRKVNLKQQELL